VTDLSFPRLSARTMNFQLGLPRGFTVSPDGGRIVFLRTESSTSRAHSLWVYDIASGAERCVADAAALLTGGTEELTAQERARRERMRVGTAGVVAYSTDDAVSLAVFALSSRLFVVDLVGADPPRELPVTASVVDPRIDPTGRRVAYADGRGVHVCDIAGGSDELVAGPADGDPDEVVWGLAEFAAAEELDRSRGFWWAPDGESLLIERYDETPVPVVYVADPANPTTEPRQLRYPQAGKANALVSLWLVGLDGSRVELDWASDRELDGIISEYLAEATWSPGGLLIAVLTRDQKRLEIRSVDAGTGTSTLLRALTDDTWIELLPGTPRLLPDGRLLHGLDLGQTTHLAIDGEPFTPPGLQVHSVESADATGVVASVVPMIGSTALARLGFDGSVELRSEPGGVAIGASAGHTIVVSQRVLDEPSVSTVVRTGGMPVGTIASNAELPPIIPKVISFVCGSRDYPTAVLFPSGHEPGSRKLPVLMDPYGGPHGRRVTNAAHAYLSPQWFADQGFVVIVADGRGMAGRGPAWDRLAHNDFIGTIDDQVEVLQAVAARYPDDVDETKVGIRGWSFGGFVAALGVLARPDVFKAAIAGAPVTDQRLYDTAYSERYLGHPDEHPDVYERNSLIPLAAGLSRPLMLIHGLVDDNVLVAHTLQLSSALLAAGRPHEVLPLSGMTHMANNEVVAENLLLLQVDFLRRSLDL
jgi:dipeptidyl-peptidase-4